MTIKILNGHEIHQICHPKAFQMFPNWNFWFENKPSGNADKTFAFACFKKAATLNLGGIRSHNPHHDPST
jgi:hypothetical protein